MATNLRRVANDLRYQLELCWDADTSAYEAWTRQTPSKGQGAVTAAIVQDVLGGQIMRAVVDGDSHYWNLVEDADAGDVELDLTRDQFRVWLPEEAAPSTRERIMGHTATVARYELLRGRLVQMLSPRDDIAVALAAARP